MTEEEQKEYAVQTIALLKEIRDELIFVSKAIQKQTDVIVRTRQPCGQKQDANQEHLKEVLKVAEESLSGSPFAPMLEKLRKATGSMNGPKEEEGG